MSRRYIALPTGPSGTVAGQIRVRCPGCGETTSSADLSSRAMVCPWCDFHFPVEATSHLRLLVDEGSFRPLAKQAGGPGLFGWATLFGQPLALALGDPLTCWTTADASILISLAEEARLEHCPLLWVVTAPRGTVAEPLWVGVLAALDQLGEASLPWIALLSGPCWGAVAAVALQADLVLAEPGAVVAPVLPAVLRGAGRLPLESRRSPRDLLRAGWADAVLPRGAQRGDLATLLALLGLEGKSYRWASPSGQGNGVDVSHPLKAIPGLLDPFFELHGDRRSEDDPALVGGLARLRHSGARLLVLATGEEQGRLVPRRRGEAIAAGGWRKATRLLRLAARFGLPVVTLAGRVGLRVRRRDRSGETAADLGDCLSTLLSLSVPTVSVHLGSGGGMAGLALSATDHVLSAEEVAEDLRQEGILLDGTFARGEELPAMVAEHLQRLSQTYAVHGPLGRRKLLQRRYARWTRLLLGEGTASSVGQDAGKAT